jgi:hypothetical protein
MAQRQEPGSPSKGTRCKVRGTMRIRSMSRILPVIVQIRTNKWSEVSAMPVREYITSAH